MRKGKYAWSLSGMILVLAGMLLLGLAQVAAAVPKGWQKMGKIFGRPMGMGSHCR